MRAANFRDLGQDYLPVVQAVTQRGARVNKKSVRFARRFRTAGLVGLLVGAIASGTSSAASAVPSAAKPVKGGSMTVLLTSDARSLDPIKLSGRQTDSSWGQPISDPLL